VRGSVLLGPDDCGLNEWKRQLRQRNGGGECGYFTHGLGSFSLVQVYFYRGLVSNS
jgi:hypothetical protein